MMGFRQFQRAVGFWVQTCFGKEVATDRMERAYRFLEEANELAQALGMTREDAHSLVDYTWNRPVGEASQEVGGVTVTLAALCEAVDIDVGRQAVNELDRVSSSAMIERIREKQKTKPHKSPLPGRAISCTCLRDHFEPRCQACPEG